jgi:hypothetical protein
MVSVGRPLYTSAAPPSRYAPAAGRLPRRAIPLFVTTEGAPAGCPAVICFPSAYRFIKLSRDQAPDGRQHRFRSGQIALSTPLQSSIRFFHPPARTPPTASLAGCLPLAGRGYAGYRVPRNYPRSLGLTRTPVAQHLRWRTLDPPSLATHLLVQATSTLGLFAMTALQ